MRNLVLFFFLFYIQINLFIHIKNSSSPKQWLPQESNSVAKARFQLHFPRAARQDASLLQLCLGCSSAKLFIMVMVASI